MKILHVISEAYETGGEERALKLLSTKLSTYGHKSIILASNANSKNRDSSESFAQYTFKRMQPRTIVGRITNQLFYFESYKKMRTVLREEKPDIVHLYTMTQLSPSVLFLLRKYKVVLSIPGPELYFRPLLLWHMPENAFANPLSRTYRSLTFRGKLQYTFHRYIQGTVYSYGLKNVTKTIVYSRYMNRIAKKQFKNLVYIPMFSNIYPSKDFISSKNLLCIGRLESFKGFQYVIEAMPALLTSFPDLTLNIVGEGNYRQSLEELVVKYKIQNSVIFHGWRNEKFIQHAYTNSTIVIMPSIWPEAFGKVGPEAMSVGRPVLATKVGGVEDWLHDGENGYYIKTNESKDITQKVLMLLDNRQLLERLGKNAAETANEFNVNDFLAKLDILYFKLNKDQSTD